MTFIYDRYYNTETRSVLREGDVVKFMNFVRKSSVFAHEFQLSHNHVSKKAKLILLNSFKVWKIGLQNEAVKKLKTNKNVSVNTTFQDLLINGLALVNNELDEGNPLAKGHPASHFLPALLEVAKEVHASGKAFLEAFIVAYELSARMGAAVELDEGLHPHGNALIYGGSFGIGKLKGYDEAEYEEAAKLHMNFQLPTLWEPVLKGHEARNVIIGLNNQHLYQIDWLMQAGYSSSLESVLGSIKQLGGQIHLDDHFTDFSRFYLNESYFKFYDYCRFTHGPIEAAIQAAEGIDLEAIQRIEVKTYKAASRLKEKEIRNAFQGKFSIPYALASELAQSRNQAELAGQLIEKIQVQEATDLTENFPAERTTRVKIITNQGQVSEQTQTRVSGDADDPDAFDRVLSQAADLGDDLIDRILNLENEKDINELLKGGV